MTLAVAVAIPDELNALLNMGLNEEIASIKGLKHCYKLPTPTGSVRYLVKLGLGPLNAAVSTTLAATHHKFTHLILLGFCGAVTKDLQIGDIVVANAIFQHDSFRSTSKNGFVMLRPGVSSLDRSAHTELTLKTDLLLTQNILKSLRNSNLPLHTGIMASGSEFMCSPDRKELTSKLIPNVRVVDMESIGVAKACENLGIKFASLKIVSDIASPKDSTIINNFMSNIDKSIAKLCEVYTCISANVMVSSMP